MIDWIRLLGSGNESTYRASVEGVELEVGRWSAWKDQGTLPPLLREQCI